jgi:hypothetical protein
MDVRDRGFTIDRQNFICSGSFACSVFLFYLFNYSLFTLALVQNTLDLMPCIPLKRLSLGVNRYYCVCFLFMAACLCSLFLSNKKFYPVNFHFHLAFSILQCKVLLTPCC